MPSLDSPADAPPAPATLKSDYAQRFADTLDRHRKPLLAVLALAYLLGFNGQWLIEPDSALYLTLGRNLAMGRDYGYLTAKQGYTYPGLPVALAAVFKIFGNHALAGADVLMLLCGAAALVLTFRLAQLAFDRPTAVVVTLGAGICYELYRYCYQIMTDMPFLAGVMAVLVGHEAIFHRPNRADAPAYKARWWDWVLLLAGLIVVVATRPTMIGLLAAWGAALLILAWQGKIARKTILLAGAAAAVVAVVFLIADRRNLLDSSQNYQIYAVTALTKSLPDRLSHEVLDNIEDLFGRSAARSAFGVPVGPWWWSNTLFGGLMLGSGLALIRFRPLWGLWVGLTIAMLILLVSHDRYIIQILPLLTIGWWRTLCWINSKLRGPWGNVAFASLMTLATVLNAVKIGAMIVNQHRPAFYEYYKDGAMPAYIDMAPRLAQRTEPSDTILCAERYSRVLTFLADRHVVSATVTHEPPVGQDYYLVSDPTEDDLNQWLELGRFKAAGPALEDVPRPGKPPLELLQGRTVQGP